MNINEFPQQVNQVISIAETILQGQILGIYFIWFSNNEWGCVQIVI